MSLIRVYIVLAKILFPLFPLINHRGEFMTEKYIEKHLRNEVEKLGGKAFKFSSPGNNGVPDRIVLYQGRCFFVELKKPGEDLRPLQKVMVKLFKKLGFKVYVIDSIEKVRVFIDEICTT